MTRTSGYALTRPDRDPLYLSQTTRPGEIGYGRGVTLDQPPGSEVTFTLGDGARKVTPLVLTGTIIPQDLQDGSEEAARIYLRELDEYVRSATGVQRDSNVTRALHPTGEFRASPGPTPLIWNFTITLYPTGPAWLDSNGLPVPF